MRILEKQEWEAGKSLGALGATQLDPPMKGWHKVNVDGSLIDSTKSIACGGVIRDHRGTWLGGFLKNIGKGDILLAETCGILNGLQLALLKKVKKIIIQL
ncbi:ribonuclease H [Senna tora]|uniref:Ribonuclease H n=1 Tax=Senna tora TaxID=362788 RepID=A0A834WHK8_9FABA|nr:ribonuclease H [Senna tora]